MTTLVFRRRLTGFSKIPPMEHKLGIFNSTAAEQFELGSVMEKELERLPFGTPACLNKEIDHEDPPAAGLSYVVPTSQTLRANTSDVEYCVRTRLTWCPGSRYAVTCAKSCRNLVRKLTSSRTSSTHRLTLYLVALQAWKVAETSGSAGSALSVNTTNC